MTYSAVEPKTRLRFLYYGKFRREWDTEAYVGRALERAGHEVRRVDQDRVLPRNLADLLSRTGGADVVLTAKPNSSIVQYVPDLKAHSRLVVSWSWDLVHHTFRRSRFRWAYRIARAVDLFLISDGFSVPELREAAAGKPIHVLRQGIGDDVRPGVHRPEWECDVLFLGNVYGDRSEFVVKLAERYGRRFRIAEGIRGGDLADLMATAKVVVGPLYPSLPGYWSNRLYVVLGYGGCFVTPTIAGMAEDDKILPGVHYEPYNPADGDSMYAAIDGLLANPSRQAMLREAGQKHALQNLTYDVRCRELVRLCREAMGGI